MDREIEQFSKRGLILKDVAEIETKACHALEREKIVGKSFVIASKWRSSRPLGFTPKLFISVTNEKS